jgi:hypothetical protein
MHSGGLLVVGLVPDGNPVVQVTQADGTVESVPVHETSMRSSAAIRPPSH